MDESDAIVARNRSIGIALFVTAQFLAAWQAGLSKLSAQELPVLMVVWGRFAGIAVVAMILCLFTVTRTQLIPNRPWLYILRGALLALAAFVYVKATTRVPLANAVAVAFVYPFLVVALAPIFLKERVAMFTWAMVFAGFAGVLIVVRPGMDGFEPYVLLALVAGICFALVLILTSILAPRAPAAVTVLWTSLTGVVITGMALPAVWVTPSMSGWLVLMTVGLFAAAGNVLQLHAARKCDMSTLAPFGYTEMISTTVIGLILFGDFPDAITWIGIAVICASGLAMMTKTAGR